MSKEAMKQALEALESQRFSKVIEAKNALEEALAKQGQGEPVAHWSDCAVHSEPAYQAGECDCGGYSPDKELLDSATAFYNATVADSQVRISSSSQEKRDAAFNASERLRFALLAKLKATDEDLKVYQSIANNYFKDTTPQQRKPLTDEQLMIALLGVDHETKRIPNGFRAFARAIEAAHGIKE